MDMSSWTVDPATSTVGFRIRHLGVATVTGRFTDFEARIDDRSASGSVGVASIDTGQPIRDARLLSDELFDVDRFPRMTFQGAAPRPGEALRGHLTIRDVTRPVSFKVAMDDGSLRATTTISRKDFGLDWTALGGAIVSDRVDLVLDLAAPH